VHGGSSGEALPGVTLKSQGPHALLGYLDTPLDETLDPEGFFRTGDGGYLDERGRLFWEGRLTDIIKTGGANVSPREVDEILAQYPGVEVAQTVGVPHEGVSLETEEICSFLRERLASHKVPRRVLFFRADEITLTGSAKIKAADLRDLAAKALATSP